MLDLNSLLDTWFTNVFSHSTLGLFTERSQESSLATGENYVNRVESDGRETRGATSRTGAIGRKQGPQGSRLAKVVKH